MDRASNPSTNISSNAWLLLLLMTIMVAMVLVFVLFDQQSKWWFGGVVNELYSSSNTRYSGNQTGGDIIYFMAFGCIIAVAVGLSLLKQSVEQFGEQENTHPSANHHPFEAVQHFSHNKIIEVQQHPLRLENRPFETSNCDLRDRLNPSGVGQQPVFVYLDSGLDNLNANVWNDIHRYFAYFGDSLKLVAPPQMVSGKHTLSLKCQIDRIHKHVYQHHLDPQSCILVVGSDAVVDTVCSVCKHFQRDVKLMCLPTHSMV